MSDEINNTSQGKLEAVPIIGTPAAAVPANKALKVLRTFIWITVISCIVMFSSCAACVVQQKAQYGDEEFYSKGGGKIGYGAKVTYSGGKATGFVALLSLLIFLISGIGAVVSSVMVKETDEKKELAVMSLESLEELLVKVRQQIAEAEVVKISPAAKINLTVKEAKIVSEISRKQK